MKEKRQKRVERKTNLGKVRIFTGDQPALAALELGLVVDAAVKEKRVCVVQFLSSAEQAASLERLNLRARVDVCRSGATEEMAAACTGLGNPEEARRSLARAKEVLQSGSYDLVVLAGATTAIFCNYITAQDLAQLIEQKPSEVELIVTGSCVDPSVAGLADSVMEIVQGQARGDAIDKLGLEYWRAGEDTLKMFIRESVEETEPLADG